MVRLCVAGYLLLSAYLKLNNWWQQTDVERQEVADSFLAGREAAPMGTQVPAAACVLVL